MMKPPKRVRQRRAIAPEDLLRFQLISDPQIAPDGSKVVFVEKHVGPRNQYVSNLWMLLCGKGDGPHLPERPEGCCAQMETVPFSARRKRGQSSFPRPSPVPRQFTSGGQDTSPRWSPDGTRIAFLRADDRTRPQIHLIDPRGGEARRLTDFPEGQIGTFCWAPNGKLLAATFRPQDPQQTDQAQKHRKQQGLSDPPRVTDDLFYRLDGEGWIGDRRFGLYLVDVESGSFAEIYGQDTPVSFTFDFSPDSRQLVVATNRDAEPTLHPWKDELLRIDVVSGKVTRIPGLPRGPKTAVRWSPDGRTIAYAGRIGKEPAYSVENLELFVCHPTRGGARSLTAGQDVCLQVEGLTDTATGSSEPALQFTPDSLRIYVRLGIGGENHVASVAVRGGPLVFHTRGPFDVRMGNLSADGRKMVMTLGNATTLAEVAVADCRARKRPHAAASAIPDRGVSGRQSDCLFPWRMLSDLNGPLLAELQLSQPESHWIRADDGHPVQLWMIRPPEMRRSRSSRKKYPALLEVHGGPHGQYCSSFFHEFQVLAAAGHIVFYSNPRGSKGYGRDHCAAIRGRWGTDDWTDLQAVIRFMKEQPQVDARRLGVIGGSYGGYMTNWIIGHCHDFAAAVSDRCLSNLVSWAGNTDWIGPPGEYFPGNFWDQSEARWNQSPLKYLGNVKTPTLLIHSEGDLRCSIEQAEQLFSALKLLGVPTRFVRYPSSTSHGMSRNGPPDLRIHRLQEILAWWQKYLGSRK